MAGKISITFCAGFSARPVGGEKVIYELANKLVDKGYQINIVADVSKRLLGTHLPLKVRKSICNQLIQLRKMPSWFYLDQRINLIAAYSYENDNFPDSNYVVATAVDTAIPVSKLSPEKGEKIYLIQDYENWVYSDDYVKHTYKLSMKDIVISHSLYDIVSKNTDNNVYLIPNAIDINLFKPVVRVNDRNKYVVGLLNHNGEHKGVKYSIEALKIAKKTYPQLQVIMFGAPKRPNDLPEWFKYYRNVPYKDMYKIFNQCAIYLCGSIDEGFGLTGAESMACGCALVSTEFKAVHEYAVNNRNALLSPVKDSIALANNLIKVIENDELRYKLAMNGIHDMSLRNWDNFIKKFEEMLKDGKN